MGKSRTSPDVHSRTKPAKPPGSGDAPEGLPEDWLPPNQRPPQRVSWGYLKRNYDSTKPPLPDWME